MNKHNISFLEFKFGLTLRRVGNHHPVPFTNNRPGLIHDWAQGGAGLARWWSNGHCGVQGACLAVEGILG